MRSPEAPTRALFRLRPSPALALAIVLAHGGAGLCAAIAAGTGAGWILGGALGALGLAAARSRAMLASPKSVRALELCGEEALLELRDGTRLDARIAPRRYVSAAAVALYVTAPARRTVLITAGMLDPESFRRLRLWALWGRLPSGVPAAHRVAPEQPAA